MSKGAHELLSRLDAQLLHRKTSRKNIRSQVLKEELEKLKQEQEANLRMSSRAMNGNMARGNLPRTLRDARGSGPDTNLSGVTSHIISAAEAAAVDQQMEEPDDTELLDDIADQESRMEPTEWECLPESGRIAV